MEVSELIELALAGVESHDVEVSSLEGAVVGQEAVTALAQIVAELVENARGFSEPGQSVRLNGVFDGDEYLISISDRGVGISENLLAALNRILQNPSPPGNDNDVALGITVVARIAARHGIGVKLIPGAPGTTARIRVPAALVTRSSDDGTFASSPGADPVRRRSVFEDTPFLPEEGLQTEEQGSEPGLVESFLESVFGPLRSTGQRVVDRPHARPAQSRREATVETRPPEPEPRAAASSLRVRVPGENFSVSDDERSIASSEAAIDLRTALSRYQSGRDDAESTALH